MTGEPLIIDDAYHLPAGMPFAFNDAFDHLAGYRTRSVLAVPLVNGNQKTVGVMQFINPLKATGNPWPLHPATCRGSGNLPITPLLPLNGPG